MEHGPFLSRSPRAVKVRGFPVAENIRTCLPGTAASNVVAGNPEPCRKESGPVRLTRIDGTCRNGTCPTVYATDRGTYVIQGYTVSDSELAGQVDLPRGEAAVEVPRELLERGARDL